MNIGLAVAIYFILWWTVLFAVLPFGVRSHKEAGIAPAEGVDPGAPVVPQLVKKAIWTTIVSTVLFFAGWAIWRAGWISLDSFPLPFKMIDL
jgi:predicted secreted protein